MPVNANAALERPHMKNKREKDTQIKQIMRRLAKNKVAMAGLVVLVLIALSCACAPILTPYDPNMLDYTAFHAAPSLAHPLGCDNLGRDILSRLLYGGRLSLLIGFTCAIVGTTGQIGGTIMSSAGLSYIGLGIQAPTAEWGAMCAAAREYLTTNPLEMLWPGLAVLITVLAINMLGDGLRDAMDPRLKD